MDYAEGSSWSDTIRNYKHSKVNLQWDPSKVEPVKRVTQAEVRAKSRAFDPILQQHMDPRTETLQREKEATQSMTQLNRARDRQLRHIQTYDPITHVPRVKERPPRPQWKKTPDTKVQYNIVSNLDWKTHHWAPPDQRPDVEEKPPRFSKNFISYAFEKRDFNVLTNKYHEDHETKVQVENQVALRQAADRLWKTQDYNPIAGKYYDKAKEKDFRRKRFEESLRHGQDIEQRLPPGVRTREGAAHDILTNTVKNPELAEKLDESSKRSRITRIRDKKDKELHDRNQEKEMLKTQHSINRIAHRRYDEQKKHGYNVVSNQPYYGVNRSSLGTFEPATTPSPSVWDKIQREHDMTTTDLLGTASLGASHPSPFHPSRTAASMAASRADSQQHLRSSRSPRPPLSASGSQPALGSRLSEAQSRHSGARGDARSRHSDARSHRSGGRSEITEGAKSVLSSHSFGSNMSNPLQHRPPSGGSASVASRSTAGTGVRTGGFR